MKKKVMIIDDEKEFLEQLGEMLDLSGYNMVLYQSGERALRNMKKEDPDIVLLDLTMDEVSGFEVADRMLTDPETMSIPVIVISGKLNEQKIHALENYGGVEKCLQKPVKPLQIISEIERVFSSN